MAAAEAFRNARNPNKFMSSIAAVAAEDNDGNQPSSSTDSRLNENAKSALSEKERLMKEEEEESEGASAVASRRPKNKVVTAAELEAQKLQQAQQGSGPSAVGPDGDDAPSGAASAATSSVPTGVDEFKGEEKDSIDDMLVPDRGPALPNSGLSAAVAAALAASTAQLTKNIETPAPTFSTRLLKSLQRLVGSVAIVGANEEPRREGARVVMQLDGEIVQGTLVRIYERKVQKT